ncbi:carbamoyl phosphate synthase large subunit [Loigolactobacillus rennini DSM 20253]|uniref:Carbamoyl phosphate synthase large subunit n=1 Tax=Loigolactobacillus rennini DSM 20253 TaxID=1423796 RepID=A0A0R2D4Z2_9LACO|nr:carbamoyl phosphate synthase large subunit [Loigolactobacillus rennini DSM 20253]
MNGSIKSLPEKNNGTKILIIGPGPTTIGQGEEFDSASVQICTALTQAGYQVILVNSNPDSIMAAKNEVAKVYVEPLTVDFMTRILRKETPAAILPTLAGKLGFNLVLALAEAGILKELHIKLLGTNLNVINQVETPALFKALMHQLKQPILESVSVDTVTAGIAFTRKIKFPVIVRPNHANEGIGGSICSNVAELTETVKNALKLSPIHQVLIEKSVTGYKEIEYEVLRDHADNALVVCNMENVDPVGIHTGDSIVTIPALTLSDKQTQQLRDAALKIVRSLKIKGNCNVQFALAPERAGYYVLAVKPRLSRSSILAAKATGYPIAQIAAKLAIGRSFDQISSPILANVTAAYEPSLDYVVTKFPRWADQHLTTKSYRLGTQMQSSGEVMGIGRNFEASLLKAIRSLALASLPQEIAKIKQVSDAELTDKLVHPQNNRLFYLLEALRRHYELAELNELTKIDLFFLAKLRHIVNLERTLKAKKGDLASLRLAKRYGFTDVNISHLWQMSVDQLRKMRREADIWPVYKMVDSCAGEWPAKHPYYYSTYETENESQATAKPAILILGAGPARIGQGAEFDYLTVQAIKAVQQAGYQAIVVNDNPAAVSTDFMLADKLYFEPLTTEEVLNIVALEQPVGALVQFSGRTGLKLTQTLLAAGIKILGRTEKNAPLYDQGRYLRQETLQLMMPQPKSSMVDNQATALKLAAEMTYPVLLHVNHTHYQQLVRQFDQPAELAAYWAKHAANLKSGALLTHYLKGQKYTLDVIADGQQVLIPGILEYIERTSIHTGDSLAVYPPQSLSKKYQTQMLTISQNIIRKLNYRGIMNIQFILSQNQLYVIALKPYANRTVPFLSQATGCPITNLAVQVLLGTNLNELGYQQALLTPKSTVFIKAPMFSFAQLKNVDSFLGPQMKSTGEVIGSDLTLEKALYKAFVACKLHLPNFGTILFTVNPADKIVAVDLAKRFYEIGFRIAATADTASYFKQVGVKVAPMAPVKAGGAQNILTALAAGKIQAVVNTEATTTQTAISVFQIRQTAIKYGIPLFTSLDTTNAILRVLESRTFTTTPLT